MMGTDGKAQEKYGKVWKSEIHPVSGADTLLQNDFAYTSPLSSSHPFFPGPKTWMQFVRHRRVIAG